MKLVFATNNQNKIDEVKAVLSDAFELKSLIEIGCEEDIPETGITFHENASQKSHYVVEKYHQDCFSDDSGLMVEALDGAPGVYSARYSGTRDMEENMDLLIRNLKGIENRKASFITVISLVMGGIEYFFEGRINGVIIDQRRGENGFGYDPLFMPEGYDKTFAEMTEQEKNSISHRAIAVKKLVGFLESL